MTQLRYWLSFIIAVIFSCTTAETLELEFPLECKLGETCFIEDYVDLDPTKEQIDYRCGIKSRNGHKGVDFGLISQQQMFAGVDVLAAASGKVIALRDGMNDVIFDSQNLETIELKECGNGVLLDRDGGWETMYCHLRPYKVTCGHIWPLVTIGGHIWPYASMCSHIWLHVAI